MKLHKDRIIQIVLAIIVVILIGFVITNNKNEEEDLLEFGENLTDEVTGETEVTIEEKTVTVPKATTTKTPAPTTTTTTTAPKTTTGSCYPGLSARESEMPKGILLAWTGCTSDDFQFYKLVKSTTNANPTYPGGSVVLSSSNKNVTTYIDKTVVSRKTYYYRVCVVERLGKVTCGNSVSITY